MAYKVVIFDLDGTLLDTLADLGEAVNHALRRRDFPLHGLEEYRRMVGHGIRNLMTQALPETEQETDALIDAFLADFKEYYTAHIDVHTHPYEGMPELLRELCDHGVALAVASNKFQAGTETLIHEFFPDIPFACILGNREGCPLKPDPEVVHEVLRKTGLPPEAAVLVGDSPTDMKTARNGVIRGIAVRWGYRDMTPADADTLASSPAELRALLLV
jgi:phosphoglycolate phosphatase